MTIEPNQDLPIVPTDATHSPANGGLETPNSNSIAPKITGVGPTPHLFNYPWAQGRSVIVAPFLVLGLAASIGLTLLGLLLSGSWFGTVILGVGTITGLVLSFQVLAPQLQIYLAHLLTGNAPLFLAGTALFVAAFGGLKLLGADRWVAAWYAQANWEALGALGEVFGALGQIMIAVIAVYVAWRQYVISRDLTIQQNTITQQQTIDAYFQGIAELVLDDEGLLEDWPQERAIAEGRTAAILTSVDAMGRAKVLRFLSRARLLSPLKRDQRLGRPILDGSGGYAEDRPYGTRVIELGIMLAGADLSHADLRWVDLSDSNLIRAKLNDCELVKANLARTILVNATLRNADINGAQFFYGKVATASPRSRVVPPDYRTGAHTGAVVENADFTNVEDMSEEQRQYICAWGGSNTRATVPGGCGDIPNKLGR